MCILNIILVNFNLSLIYYYCEKKYINFFYSNFCNIINYDICYY